MPTEVAVPPPDVRPLAVSNKQMDKYGLKTGPGRKDTLPYKLFPKQEMLDEVAQIGFYSAFHEIRAEVQAYPGDEILLVADATERYGENWYICLSVEARTRELQAFEAAERAAEEAKRKAAEDEARRRAEEEALQQLVVCEAPLVARPYKSATSADTAEEVLSLTVRQSRPLLSVRVQRRRYQFGAKSAFNDREADGAIAEFRPRKEPNYELKRRELSIGLQACPPALSGYVESASQTVWFAPMAAAVQCDLEAEAAAAMPADAAAVPDTQAADSVVEQMMAALDLRAVIAQELAAAAALESGTAADSSQTAGVAGPGGHALMSRAAAAASDAGRGHTGGGSLALSGGGGFGSALGSMGVGGRGAAKATMTPAERLVEFMYRSTPLVEHALSQNETLNIFRNELMLLADDEVMVMGHNEAKSIREERQFMDLDLSNNKALVAVEWHPKSPSWLAVSAVPRLTFERRIAESGTPRVSYVLLYTLGEFSNQLVLECPADAVCMHWNPTDTNLLAVGCVTGQIAVFDMSDANDAMAARKKTEAAGGSATAGGDVPVASMDDGSSKAPHVKPKAMSLIEASHSRGVVGVRWLPPSHHLTHRNAFMEERTGESYQILSAAGDGSICVWDTRYRERVRKGRRASVDMGGAGAMLSSALVPGAAAAGVHSPPAEVPWAPMYKVALRHGLNAINLGSFLFDEKEPSAPLICGTEEGRVVAVDWAPPGEGTGQDAWLSMGVALTDAQKQGGSTSTPSIQGAPDGSGDGGADGSGHPGGVQRLLWLTAEADRPAVAMHRSPFLPDVFLVVNDFSFAIWRVGVRQPVFVSPACPSAQTAGRWSPSRPAVLFIGRGDGMLDVWDLLDSTTKPSVTFTLMSLPVTSLEFRPAPAVPVGASASTAAALQKQLLAVGDAKGSLHVLEIPLPLRKGTGNEEALLSTYLEREAARVSYVAQRTVVRDAEKVKKDADSMREATAREAEAAKAEQELQAAVIAMLDRDPVAAHELTLADLAAQRAATARVAAEEKYRALEKSIMAELGVDEAELAPAGAGAPATAAVPAASPMPPLALSTANIVGVDSVPGATSKRASSVSLRSSVSATRKASGVAMPHAPKPAGGAVAKASAVGGRASGSGPSRRFEEEKKGK